MLNLDLDMKTFINFFIILPFLFTQCKVDAPIPIYGKFGEDFTLKYRQCIILNDSSDIVNDKKKENFTVCFTKLIKETRCPEGVYCIQAGEAIIELSIEKQGIKKIFVEISPVITFISVPGSPPIIDKRGVVDTLGYLIELLDLKPYPKKRKKKYIASKYKALLNISK